MDELSNQFLPRPALTGEEDRGIGASDPLREIDGALECRGNPKDGYFVAVAELPSGGRADVSALPGHEDGMGRAADEDL